LIIWSTANLIGLINRLYLESNQFLENIAILFTNLAVFIQIFYVEKNIKLYKYRIFTIVQLCICIALLILTNFRNIANIYLIFLILMGFGFAILPVVYFYIALKANGNIRVQTFKIGIAFVLIAVGTLIQSQYAMYLTPQIVIDFQTASNINWAIIPTTISLIGVILLFVSYLNKFIKK
jgi:hypothetical protein